MSFRVMDSNPADTDDVGKDIQPKLSPIPMLQKEPHLTHMMTPKPLNMGMYVFFTAINETN